MRREAGKEAGQAAASIREFYDTRHNEGSTLLFCDGHAKCRKKASLLVSEFGLVPKAADEKVIRLTLQDRREVAF
jgi:prepilin-type processing-associated H-X9-DG protein